MRRTNEENVDARDSHEWCCTKEERLMKYNQIWKIVQYLISMIHLQTDQERQLQALKTQSYPSCKTYQLHDNGDIMQQHGFRSHRNYWSREIVAINCFYSTPIRILSYFSLINCLYSDPSNNGPHYCRTVSVHPKRFLSEVTAKKSENVFPKFCGKLITSRC